MVYTTIRDSVFFLTIKIIEATPGTTLFGEVVLLQAFSVISHTYRH